MDFSFHQFGLAFIPIFVAIDVVGVIPMFISLTHELEPKIKKINSRRNFYCWCDCNGLFDFWKIDF